MIAAVPRERALFWVSLALALGPALLFGGALGFQYLGDLPPCELCIYQRVPLALAIPLALAALATRKREEATAEGFLAAAGIVIAIGAGIAVYHLGIEQRWWLGPTACTGFGSAIPGSVEDLQSALRGARIVPCDVVPWSLFGISLAGFNAIFSALLAALALLPGLRRLFGRKADDGTEKAKSREVA
jgi:disulfide bond formation protein DsbB